MELVEPATHLPAPTVDPQVTEEMQHLLLRGQEGDLTALPELKHLLDTRRDLWEQVGDLAKHAELSQLNLLGGKNLLVKEAAQRKLAEVKAELAGPSPTPLERLLIDRIGVCWLQVHHLDMDASQILARDRGTSTWSVYAQKRLDSAHRRYLLAVKTLAVVRKLLKLGECAEKEVKEPKEPPPPAPPKKRGRSLKVRQELVAGSASSGIASGPLAPAEPVSGQIVHT